MALLFSAVTVTANDKKVEFLVGGIPREFGDLEGWTAFERFLEDISEDTTVKVHAEANLYGGEEIVKATPEEIAYFIQFIDLCSGIGGFHSGLMATDHYECVGHAEIDPNAAKAYKAIYGEEGGLNYGDLREIEPKNLPDFDLLCAGFPCQSFSVVGRRLGFQDTRGTVFFEIARIIAEKRPPFLLLENVPGLLSHDGGRTLTVIFSTLVEMGYHLEWMVLNSKYFGVPQQRRRLYIVGYLDARCAGKIFPLGSSYAKNLKQLNIWFADFTVNFFCSY